MWINTNIKVKMTVSQVSRGDKGCSLKLHKFNMAGCKILKLIRFRSSLIDLWEKCDKSNSWGYTSITSSPCSCRIWMPLDWEGSCMSETMSNAILEFQLLLISVGSRLGLPFLLLSEVFCWLDPPTFEASPMSTFFDRKVEGEIVWVVFISSVRLRDIVRVMASRLAVDEGRQWIDLSVKIMAENGSSIGPRCFRRQVIFRGLKRMAMWIWSR